MALSQIQCLDDHHVNWRVSESKPEFFYSEDQRLALEALVTSGRDAFMDYIRQNNVREFLSEQELERISLVAELYRPGHEHHQKPETPAPGSSAPGLGNVTPGSGEEHGDGEVSLQYWPDRSEFSVAELDLGWPEAISYRGVTRVTVYTQPPTDGHTHIKEVVRKSIASAQKVIAVVMDAFTDVDIFRDLMDAAFKRRIPVYIILDQAGVPSFLSMCGRADMHRGHLKNLRVRCCGGVEFYTRSAQKVRGSLSQKFLLVDGDRAISGSYSFTWSSSRLDRNLITVITGQAVETFDLQFQELFLMSRGVSLSKVPLVDEPIPEPVPHVAPAPISAAIARKLVNPKYSLVTTGAHASLTSSDQNSTSKNPTGLKVPKGRCRGITEEPALHPGLAHLEKAYLIPYLPTWPEPDPPSDVIGFINIRDEKRAHQVHLQRSERFEVSQAIRFTSPLTLPASPDVEKKTEGKAENPSGNKESDIARPGSPTKKQLKKSKTQTAPEKERADSTDQTDSRAPPQQPDTHTPDTHTPHTHTPDTHTLDTHTPLLAPNDPATSQPAEGAKQTPDAVAPPVPKRRTLQLVIDPASSEQTDQPQVTLVKMDQLESLNDSRTTQEKLRPGRSHTRINDDGRDSASNEDGSQDSTKVICDRAANDDPSSHSGTSEEEVFFDCSQPAQRDPLTNGVTTGSGRGPRLGDRGNLMARFSQSMLDLREPAKPEDSSNLIRQSQQLRRQTHPSPHRHIGQLFQSSRSPVRDARFTGAKGELSKSGSFHHPALPAGPMIGGQRYWQGQAPQPDSSQLRGGTRSGRSPRRHSPGFRNTDHKSPQPPGNSSGLLGVQFSKLNHLKHLKARAGTSQKKGAQSNKAFR